MTEYYTTQSLATAAAAIEQGFEGCETKDVFDIWHPWFTNNPTSKWRFPKTPHNVGLMRGQEGDLVQYDFYRMGENEPTSTYYRRIGTCSTPDNEGEMLCILENDDEDVGCEWDDFTRIIERNNKPFPVWDEETKSPVKK